MEIAESFSSTRPYEGGDESSGKRVRSLAGMLLFDGIDTFDRQHSIHDTRTQELSGDQRDQLDSTDHMQQTQTSQVCGNGKLNRNLICTVTELAS